MISQISEALPHTLARSRRTLLEAEMPMFLALGSMAPPTDTISSPFFIRETLRIIFTPLISRKTNISYSYLKLSPASESAFTEKVKK